ncbi:hypothetical protein CY34DRAFT_67690, partial [Suillus luteus UH-Slu-Lm8-n1]
DILANRFASEGGIWPVDIFPALKHLPLWFPGVSFKRNAVIWKAKMEEFVDRPYEFVKSEISSSSDDHDSFFSSQDTTTDDHDIRWTTNSMYSASINMTITTLSHFILAMVQHPHVLRRTQAELDDVLGS